MITFSIYVGCVGVIMFAAYWVIRLGVRHGVMDAMQRVPQVPAQRAAPLQRPAAAERVGSVPPPRETV